MCDQFSIHLSDSSPLQLPCGHLNVSSQRKMGGIVSIFGVVSIFGDVSIFNPDILQFLVQLRMLHMTVHHCSLSICKVKAANARALVVHHGRHKSTLGMICFCG